ncbi:MAG: FAD/NAD(P)-binding oxidoreductase [Bacillota bacterium]|nr:FAD/NAD(P)-binding oxidoreductase [Bacillota bacterium]
MRYVIAGAGAAGSACARALLDLARPDSGILVLEAAADPPPSPALLPEFAAGAVAPDMLAFAQAWRRAGLMRSGPLAPRLVLRTGCRVRGVDPGRQVLRVSGGEEIGYDRLLLATGGGAGLPRWAIAAGLTGPGVLALSSWRQAGRLRRMVAGCPPGSTIAVIGAGPTGLRVAEALLCRGLRVVLSEALAYPLGMLGSEAAGAGAVVRRIATEAGIRVLSGAAAARAERGPGGKLEGITHVAGGREETVRCDVAVLCTGSAPAVPRGLSAFSGGGSRPGSLCVDEGMRTSAPGVWAAGDIALPGGWDRPPGLWHVASWQGRQAALTMSGRPPGPHPARVDLTVRFLGHLIRAWRPYADPAGPAGAAGPAGPAGPARPGGAGAGRAPWQVTVAPAAVAAEPPRAAPLYSGVASGAN